jgi:hypothetical protein
LARISQEAMERFYNLLAVGEGGRCLKWVIRVDLACDTSPLIFQFRTYKAAVEFDAMCHEPTYAVQQIWSLLDQLVGSGG